MHIILLFCFITIISLRFGYCTDYYLKIGGIDSASCTTYNNPCATLDYVMFNKEDNEYEMLNNTNKNHTVYIDTGNYYW
jgi:hypothetical protein